jgi:hypothetical protein
MSEAAVARASQEPWEPSRSIAAQLAMGSLLKFFPKSLTQNGSLQLETLFCSIGAVAGFAAQHALRQHEIVGGNRKENEVFVVVLAPNGERYFFGDALNAALVPERRESIAVWSILGGAALKLGAAKTELPDCLDTFERATKSIGTPEFGIPQLPPGHKPYLTPRRALEIFWPPVLQAFTREPIVPVPGFKLVEPRYWSLILATVAASFMPALKDKLPPALAMRIFMEAAIPMSKIDPSAVRFVGVNAH